MTFTIRRPDHRRRAPEYSLAGLRRPSAKTASQTRIGYIHLGNKRRRNQASPSRGEIAIDIDPKNRILRYPFILRNADRQGRARRRHRTLASSIAPTSLATVPGRSTQPSPSA